MKRKKFGFTLIELLVVIAIIALLLGILVPGLQKAKLKMEELLCKVNLKAYGTAMKVYVEENDQKYPDCFTSVFAGTPPGVPLACQWHVREVSPNATPDFAGPLWDYMAADAAHMCGTFKRFAMQYGAQHPGHNSSIPIDPQYAFSQNAFLGPTYNGVDSGPGVLKESEVVNPAGVLTWVEETIWLINEEGPGGLPWARWTLNDTCFFSRHTNDGTRWGDFIATYHRTPLSLPEDGMGDAVFVDGHVETLDPYFVKDIGSGLYARAGFIYSWPKTGRYSTTCPY